MPSPPIHDAVLQARNLSKAYAPGSFAIRGVDLRVDRSDFIAVIGRSGAGKSTLLRCLNLLVRPTEGTIHLRGVEITASSGREVREVRGRVGMIFQGFNLVRRLSVLDNVLCGRLRFRTGPLGVLGGILRVFPRREREAAFECLRKVHIEHLAFRRADTLSGGQQQRVAIARVLAQEPEVILADEPIASLDPRSAESVMATLREIHDSRGIPVVVNLHQVDVARAFASRIVGMAAGRVRLDEHPGGLSAAAIDELYRGEPRPAERPAGPVGRRVPGDMGVLATGALT